MNPEPAAAESAAIGVWEEYSEKKLAVQAKDPQWDQARCRQPDCDPEWWVADHLGKSHSRCVHSLAAHICQTHCPIFDLCASLREHSTVVWTGVVLAGEWIESAFAKGQRAMQPQLSCHICGDQPATLRAVASTLLAP